MTLGHTAALGRLLSITRLVASKYALICHRYFLCHSVGPWRHDMASRIDRYKKCVATCTATAYGSGASVRRHNAAATKMRDIVVEPGAAEELLPLLDESESAEWLAFQLLELCQPSPAVRERCLAIIRSLAGGSGVDALGAQSWLRDFER